MNIFDYMRAHVKDDCDTLEACYLGSNQGEINVVLSLSRIDKELANLKA